MFLLWQLLIHIQFVTQELYDNFSKKIYNINYTTDKIQDTYILFTFSVVEEQDHIEPGSCQTIYK